MLHNRACFANNKTLRSGEILINCVLLVPKNAEVFLLNYMIISKFPGDEQVYDGVDSTSIGEAGVTFSPEMRYSRLACQYTSGALILVHQ